MPTSRQLVTQLGCLSAQQTYGSHLKKSILLNDLFCNLETAMVQF